MRDARSGGGKSKPHLISEHGAGQQANKKPTVKRPRPVAASSRGHAGVAQLLTPHRPQKPTRDYPGAAFHGPGWKKQSPVHITQSLLEDVGLGGAAHPIRRLQHPGGRMEFPGFGGARLTVKAARAELEASPIRNAFHANIEKTVPDAGIAKGLKKAYDTQVLRASKNHGLGPNEYLKRVHEQQPEAVQKAQAGLASAPAAYRATKTVRSEELGKRVERGAQALAEGTGDEAFHGLFSALKGPLPHAEFSNFRDLTKQQIADLNEHVRAHDNLTPLEKGTAFKAIKRAHEKSIAPPPHAHRILEKAFGPEAAQELFHPSRFSKAGVKHAVVSTMNVPRAIMSSVDLSGLGRQGLVGLISHPVISSKEIGPMLKAFKSEEFYKNWRATKLEKDPFYERALKDRLAVTDVERSLGNREEPFQSDYAEKITGGKRSPVRMSGRAYSRVLVGQRFGIYKHLAMQAEDAGRSLDEVVGKNGQTLGEQIADLAGDATGRGQGKPGGFFERNAVELNATLFSPRLIKSRLDFLNPLGYHRLDPLVRAEKMKMAAKTIGAISAFLYAMSKVPGVKVEADPRSTDFGKIRIGNTRIDVAGGFNQYIRFFAQEITGQQKDVNTGDIKHGQNMDAFNRFWKGKLAPTAGLGTSLVFRQNYAGQTIDPTSGEFWKQQAASMGTPLGFQDAYQTYQQTHNPAAAAGAFGVSAVGAGIQSYGPPKPTGKTPEDLRNDLRANVRKYFKRGLTPQLKEALKLRESRETYMKKVLPKRPGRGATEEEKKTYGLHRFNAQVDLLVKMGKINRGQARKAKAWARSQDRHKVSSETTRVGHKYFGGDVLSDATKKIRERGGHLYLSDY